MHTGVNFTITENVISLNFSIRWIFSMKIDFDSEYLNAKKHKKIYNSNMKFSWFLLTGIDNIFTIKNCMKK